MTKICIISEVGEVRPDEALQKRSSWFLEWIQKVQRNSNLIDLVNRFFIHVPFFLNLFFGLDPYFNNYLLANRLRYSQERVLESLPKDSYTVR